MVALASPRLEFVPEVNLSRMYLHRAYEALEAGQLFQAGCLLRESIRRQLYAECNWKGCLPSKKEKQRSPMALLHALKDAGHCGPMGCEWTQEAIELTNKCAHCVPVSASLLRTMIEWWHTSIDCDPCGEPRDRDAAHCEPHTKHELLSDDDCDDDDHGDDWKIGGGV